MRLNLKPLLFIAISTIHFANCSPSALDVYEVNGSYMSLDNIEQTVDTFYLNNSDEFDFLVLWGSPSLGPGHSFFIPTKHSETHTSYLELKNIKIKKLIGIVWMGPDWVSNDQTLGPRSNSAILAHEIGHAWGIDLQAVSNSKEKYILTDASKHWSFFAHTGASPLGGNNWIYNPEKDSYTATPNDHLQYSDLTLYMMGLMEKANLEPTMLLFNPRNMNESPLNIQDQRPQHISNPIEIKATPVFLDINELTNSNNKPLVPVFSKESKLFKSAWIYVSKNQFVDGHNFDKLQNLARAWKTDFQTFTKDLSKMEVTL